MAESDYSLSQHRLLRCSQCREVKLETAFYVRRSRKKRGRHYRCKACESKYQQTPQARVSQRKRTKEFLLRLKESNYGEYQRRVRAQNLRKLHQIELSEYEAMLAAQNGRCAICGREPFNGKGQRLHVDHDHITGKTRGLLCTNCNMGLGAFDDNRSRLAAAIAYLKQHSTE